MTEIMPGGTASADLTRMLLKYASKASLEIRDICDAVTLDPSVLKNAGARIPIEQFNSIWEEIVSRTADNNFGLHFGQAAHHFLTGHVLFSVMMNCATVGEALEKYFRYHNLMADVVRPEMKPEDDLVHIRFKTIHPRVRLQRHHSEYILSMLTSVLRQLTENKMRMIQVDFEHPRPADISEHQRIFQSRLIFEKGSNSLVFKGDCLKLPVFMSNPGLLETLEQYAQKLLDKVRKELALDYLKNPDMALYDVAFLLGFADQSAFNHAFRRWTGSYPMEYRV